MKKGALDLEVEQRIAAHIERHHLDGLDVLKLFPVLVRRHWLKRFLAHVEFFRMALDVPGDIAELGVWRGAGLMTWANLLESFAIGNRTKVVYGFDNWSGFSSGLAPEDGPEIPAAGKTAGGFSPEAYYGELREAIALFDADRFIPQKARVVLVEGDIESSVPRFVAEHAGVRLSLVHFDCDLYRPTRAALAALWPIVSVGGVVLFDEYGIHDWPGETQAVDEFLAQHPGLRLRTLNWTNTPAAYLVKE
jgi:hypothetical protein